MGEAVAQRAGETLIADDAGPLIERQVRRDDGRAAFMALAEDFEEQLRAGLREQRIAELVDDEQLDGGKLRLKPQQAFLVARLDQLMNEPGGRRESDGEAALAGGEASAKQTRVFPAPLLPNAMMLSRATTYAQRASSRVSGLLSEGIAVKSNGSKLLIAGNRAETNIGASS